MTYKSAVEILMKRVEEMREWQILAEETGHPRHIAMAKVHEKFVKTVCDGFRKKGFNPDNAAETIYKFKDDPF